MSVSIISCPGCKSLILSDTLQCPTCEHVLNPERSGGALPDLPSVARAGEDEIPCPDCGEMVRSGLVRCWRCGGFLREEIAETYQRLLDAPQKVHYSLAEQAEQAAAAEAMSRGDAAGSGTESPDDDDFELAPGLDLLSEEELAARQEAARSVSPKAENPVVETVQQADPDSGVKVQTAEVPAAAASPKAEEPPKKFESTGDPLLDIALQEENEAASRAKDRKKTKAKAPAAAMPGFVFVFCPNGHRIQVEERYRGQTGRCPKCKSFFHVPNLDWAAKKDADKEAEESQRKLSLWHTWKLDLHLHHVDPSKLKLKPGSLEKDFQEIDLGWRDGALIVTAPGKQGAGLFAGEKNKKKREEYRAEVFEHLRLEQEILDLPAAGYRLYEQAAMEKIQVVQPAAYAHESMFAGVAVFGEGRIAVRFPVTDQDKDVKDILFVSFWLSEFREFAAKLEEIFGIKELGRMEGVPLEDSWSDHKCHYSDRKLRSLDVTPFHTADPMIELEIVGFKCGGCGLIVSEESRKKEKLGGAAGKGIAKAKCPKCQSKFGNNPLQSLKKVETEEGAELAETGGMPA